MAAQNRGQQIDKMHDQGQNQRYKYPSQKFLIITIIFILLLISIGLIFLWIEVQLGNIPKPWSKIVTSVLGTVTIVLGTIFSTVSAIVIAALNKDLFQKIFSHRFGESETPENNDASNDSTPLTGQQAIMLQQNPALQFNPTIIIGSSPSIFPAAPISKSNNSEMPLQINKNSNKQQDDSAIVEIGRTVTEEKQDHFRVVFQFNEPLTDHNEFYGRTRERTTLISRTSKGASTSVVGQRRIGKTWLISYLRSVAKSELGSGYRIGYLQATAPSCATLPGFTAKALEELLGIPMPENTNIGLDKLEQAVENLKSKNLIPILCIDEFEGLCRQKDFTLEVLENLRAITQVGLGLVVASKRPLIDVVVEAVGESGRTSPLFNVFEQLTLKAFSNEDAERFTQIKSIQANFTEKEHSLLLQYGRHKGEYWPLRLQLVGKMLLEDKHLSTIESSHYYRPNDPDYWRDFEKRLEEIFQGVVR